MSMNPFETVREVVDTSPAVADEIKTTTCYMCACRCGIKVYLRDGRIRYIEGNRDHPVNKGVLCGKGSAGIMQHYSPARLSKPLLRVGERGRARTTPRRHAGARASSMRPGDTGSAARRHSSMPSSRRMTRRPLSANRCAAS